MKEAEVRGEGAHSLSIIVMAYDEVDNLEHVLREVDEHAMGTGRPYEIIIVDDGSTDGTAELADDLSGRISGARTVHHERNKGIGEVLRTGFNEARHDLVTIVPADGQYPAEILHLFLPHMAEHDVVLGYVPKRDSPIMAIVLSRIERILLTLLFGRFPEFQGIYMFRRSLLQRFPLTSQGRGWIIQMELIIRAKRAGCRITSVQTPMRRRLSGESKARNLKSVIANTRQMLALFWRMRIWKDRRG